MPLDPAFSSPTRAYDAAMAGADTVQQRATPAAAFAAARARLRAGIRLDMAALAAEIGVSRATLYRWTGDRDRLLADVIWAELSEMVDYFDTAAEGEGVQRMTNAVGDFLDTLSANPALQAFLANEGENGLALVTAIRGGVRPRLQEKIAAVIEREARGGYRPPAAPALLADGLLCLAERWLYNGGESTLNPDPATAKQVIALLLRP